MDIEIQEEFMRQQQRFEAALTFITKKTWWEGEFTTLTFPEAIKRADELLKELNETRK